MSRLLTNDVRHVWAAEITKYDERDDGTIDVTGVATSPALDIDDQVCDPLWLKRAMPAWFGGGGSGVGGNVREMHQPSAVGVATGYSELEGDKHEITAHIVDPGAVAKVRAGVYKGFSIGIKKPRVVQDKVAAGGRIVDGSVCEVSLVDRPANPDATLTLAKMADGSLAWVEKRDMATSELNDLPDSAFAYIEPGGKKDDQGKTVPRSKRHFPIHDEAHVRNALSRAPQSPFGAKAMPKIRAAAKKFGINVAKTILPSLERAVVAELAKAGEAGGKEKPGHAQHDPDFAAAWVAIARLIQQEGAEMEQLGEDETDCIARLVCALQALRSYAKGEAAEGENVTSQIPNGEQLLTSDGVTMSTQPDVVKGGNDPAQASGKLTAKVAKAVSKAATKGLDPATIRRAISAASSVTLSKAAQARILKGDGLPDLDDLVDALTTNDDPVPDPASVAAKLTAKIAKAIAKALARGLDPATIRSVVDSAATAALTGSAAAAKSAQIARDAARRAVRQETKATKKLRRQLLKDAAQAQTERDEVLDTLRKVSMLPMPGGPTRMATFTGIPQGVVDEVGKLRKEAADHRREADKHPAQSDIAKGFRELAEEAEEKASKLADEQKLATVRRMPAMPPNYGSVR